MAGFAGDAPPRTQVMAVATVNGSAVALGRQHPRTRLWVLEDRTAVLCISDSRAPGGVRREVYPVLASVWQERSKLLTVDLDGDGTVTLNAKGCGCGMGAAGNAGPSEGPYDVVRVRAPDWHTVERT